MVCDRFPGRCWRDFGAGDCGRSVKRARRSGHGHCRQQARVVIDFLIVRTNPNVARAAFSVRTESLIHA